MGVYSFSAKKGGEVNCGDKIHVNQVKEEGEGTSGWNISEL